MRSHAARILSKPGLRHQVQVVTLAYEAGPIHPGVR